MAAQKSTSSTKKTTSAAKGKPASGKAPPARKPAPKSSSGKGASAASRQEQQPHAARQRTAILLLGSALFLFFVAAIEGQRVWFELHQAMFGLFGVCAWAVPAILVALAVVFTINKPLGSMRSEFIFAGLFVVILAGIVHVGFNDAAYLESTSFGAQIRDAWESDSPARSGGVLGVLVGNSIASMFGKVPAMITMILMLFVFFMLFSGTTLLALYYGLSRPVKRVGQMADARIEQGMRRHEEHEAQRAVRREEKAQRREQTQQSRKFDPNIRIGPEPAPKIDYAENDNFLPDFIYADNDRSAPKNTMRPPVLVDSAASGADAPVPAPDIVPDEAQSGFRKPPKRIRKGDTGPEEEIPAPTEAPPEIPAAAEPIPEADVQPPRRRKTKDKPQQEEKPSESQVTEVPAPEGEPHAPERAYRKPPLSCLAEPVYNAEYGGAQAEIERNSALLIKTLESFNVRATITDVSRGPSVTRYELLPAEGVKISKITNLADDIALRLASSGVRIEAPIPNKAAIGIEVPNRAKTSVTLREIIDTDVYRRGREKSILNVALGKDIAGNVICVDLARMPHLLIAGTTGSGKSVCVNSMIMSILFNAEPTEVKLLMIDPKQVEFTVYGGIPHLLVPVVSDPRKASGALNWAVTEMLGRYKKFAERNVRDITGYNKLAAKEPELEPMNRIVIFIDELSDLMMVAQSEVEDAICRLAQMARAAGMHLVIATQRPSVDVITGLIKANIPSRIALSVSSQIDSRTILDSAGAEKLLGYGDMLYSPVGMAKPLRVQGAFVSDGEVENVVNFIKNQSETVYDEAVMDEIERQAVAKKKGADMPEEQGEASVPGDEKLQKAIEVVVEAGMASTTLLQRKLSLGYARAARLIDELEERKIVGPFEGSKPRKVLITKQQWMEMCALSGDAAVTAPAVPDVPPFDPNEYEEEDEF